MARPGVELLVGRTATLNLDMAVSGVQETVTVTGEAPLIDTTSSNIASNIDPRQMQDLPLNGRNWMDLTLLSPGSRTNAATEIPYDRQGYFQINVDGQQVTFTLCCQQNQPRFSRDSIAEFELTTNRFDATKGRTAGMMVNAITKSGTNTPSGTFSGFVRDDSMNAKDHIQDRVLPYSNQNYSGTFGGPIIRDRMHFFGNWEYEREPSTVTFSEPVPVVQPGPDGHAHRAQGGSEGRLAVHPADAADDPLQPLPDRDPEPRQRRREQPPVHRPHRRARRQPVVRRIQPGAQREEPEPRLGRLGLPALPAEAQRRVWDHGEPARRRARRHSSATSSAARRSTAAWWCSRSRATTSATRTTRRARARRSTTLRDDFTTSFNAGRPSRRADRRRVHPLHDGHGVVQQLQRPLGFNVAPPANIEQLIPVWDDASTWNLRALSPLVVDYRIAIGDFAWAHRAQHLGRLAAG